MAWKKRKILVPVLTVCSVTFFCVVRGILYDYDNNRVNDAVVMSQEYNKSGEVLAEYKEINRDDYRAAAEVIADAMKNGETEVNLSSYNIDADKYEYLMGLVIEEDMYAYYSSLFTCTRTIRNTDNTIRRLSFDYGMTKSEVKSHYYMLNQVVEDIIEYVPDNLSDEEKVLYIHDYLVNNVSYNYEDYVNETLSDDDFLPYGALVDKTAINGGYATAFYILMNELSVDTSIAYSEDNHREWNMVYIDGYWYHVDVASDDPVLAGEDVKGYVSHKYFLLNDSQMNVEGYTNIIAANFAYAETYENLPIRDVNTAISYINGDYYYALNSIYKLSDDFTSSLRIIDDEKIRTMCSSDTHVYYARGCNIYRSNLDYTNESLIYTDESSAYADYAYIKNMYIADSIINYTLTDYELINEVSLKSVEIKKSYNYSENDNVSVKYRTHVQTYGWQDYVLDGDMSGTEGKAKRLEGIQIMLDNSSLSGGVAYRTHVQIYGWQDYVSDGDMAGTEGQAKRLEAIEITLTDELMEKYDIYYRVHIQTYGWLGWAKNGEKAGSSGLSKRLEGIEIKLVNRGNVAPGQTDNAYITR